MSRLSAVLCHLLLLLGGLSFAAQAKALAAPEAILTFANREIVVLRATV